RGERLVVQPRPDTCGAGAVEGLACAAHRGASSRDAGVVHGRLLPAPRNRGEEVPPPELALGGPPRRRPPGPAGLPPRPGAGPPPRRGSRLRMLRPSKLPSGVTPNCVRTASPASSPSAALISSGVQT